MTLTSLDATPVELPVFVAGTTQRFGIISDIDDTVLSTSLPKPMVAAWNTFVRSEWSRRAVPGMATMYRELVAAHPGAPIIYLSTGAWNTAPSLERFLRRNGFPVGPMLLTDWGPTSDGWFRSGQAHKRGALHRLAREMPHVQWLLIGDDGQHDPRIYTEFAASRPDAVRAIAIRQLSVGEQVMNNGIPVGPDDLGPPPDTRPHRPGAAGWGRLRAGPSPASRSRGPPGRPVTVTSARAGRRLGRDRPGDAGLRQTEPMPELPEVQALADFLAERTSGLAVTGAEIGSISVLKTFTPPPQALVGAPVEGVARFGKFLDIDCGGTHLVFHLARAGWLRWSDQVSTAMLRPGKSPIAMRVRFSDGSGFDLTEAGTKKRLAAYIVADPQEVPGIASLGPDPLADGFTEEAFAGILAGRRAQIKGVLRDQSTIAGIGNAYSDEILHAARLSPFAIADTLPAEVVAEPVCRAPPDADDRRRRRVGQAGEGAQGRQAGGDAGARSHRRDVPRVR